MRIVDRKGMRARDPSASVSETIDQTATDDPHGKTQTRVIPFPTRLFHGWFPSWRFLRPVRCVPSQGKAKPVSHDAVAWR